MQEFLGMEMFVPRLLIYQNQMESLFLSYLKTVAVKFRLSRLLNIKILVQTQLQL